MGAITKGIFSISWYWWIVIIVVMAVVWRGRKDRVVDGLIAGYVLLILVITVLGRPVGIRQVEMRLFWSYGVRNLDLRFF